MSQQNVMPVGQYLIKSATEWIVWFRSRNVRTEHEGENENLGLTFNVQSLF
jgi:hypothetical protein